MIRHWTTPGSGLLLNPHGRKGLLDVFEMEEEAEEELVSEDGLPRDDER